MSSMSSHFDDEDEPVPEPPPAEPIDDEPTPPVDAFLDAHRLQDRRPSVVRPVRPAPIASTDHHHDHPPYNNNNNNNNNNDDDDAPPPPPPSVTRVRSMTVDAHQLPPPPLPPLLRVSSSSPPPVPQSAVSPRHAVGGRARAGTVSDARSPRAHESSSAPAQPATVKIFFRSLESGVSKVLPIDAGTPASVLVAELLRKLALAKIKVPEGRYELQAVAAGFVHPFADHETPQALLTRQQGTQLICCRVEATAAPRIAPVAGVLRDETGRIVPAGADAARPLSPPPIAPQIGHFQGSYRPPPPPPTNVKPFSRIVQKVEMLDDDDEDDDDDDEDENNADDAAAPHSNLGVLNRHLEMQVSGRRRGSKGLLSASAEKLASLLSPQPEEPPEDGADDEDDDDMFRRALNAHAAQLVANGDGNGDGNDDVPPPPSHQYDDDEELPPPPPLALPSDLTPAPPPVRRNANMERRVQLVRELVDTERTYVRSLTLLKEQYMLPLEKAELLSKDEVKVVFSNVALLHSVHKELLSDLGARFYAATDQAPCIGDIFAHLAPYLKLYAQYYRDFDRADQELKRVMQRSRVQAFCDKTKSEDPRSRNLDLISYLIMPVQRLPRYVLLLQQLVEATPREHADYAPLASALKQMREIVSSADAAVPPPPLTEAGKALAALGPTFAELHSSSLQLCDYAQRWRDAQLKSGGAVRLWLLREWLVVAPARGVNVPHTVSKVAVSTKRYPAQQADVATVLGDTPSGLVDALRIPLSHVWVKRITWSDGLFELLSPLASHSFLLEMPTRARERWINKIHQLTQADALTPQQRAERARIEAPSKVFVNQIHWDSAFELPPARFATPAPQTQQQQQQQQKAAPAAAAPPQQLATVAKMTPAEVQEYKAAMKRKYAEEQRRSLALAAQRAAEAPPPPPSSGGAAAHKPSRPKVCQRCNAGKVFARCRVVGDGAIIYVCEPCASELAANHKTRKTAPPTRSVSASDAPPEPADDE